MQDKDKARDAIALKLKAGEATALLQCYGRFDGYERVVGEGDAAKTVIESYSFPNGITYLRIAKNLNALKAITSAAEQARQALLKSLLPEGKSELRAKESPEAWAAYAKGVEEIMQGESEVALDVIPMAEFGNQPVPPSVLAKLYEHGLVTE